jgi:hypothetical protein
MELSDVPEKIPSDRESIPGPLTTTPPQTPIIIILSSLIALKLGTVTYLEKKPCL